ncbi:hypothetical protein ACT3CD_09295 [Geofilum sp. OHC36d9]|jgi:hypothetical protein|uniref:hypothetical protein n=1 Tax=Geofilum sp. OHC36d9 TaxID=3458413 RepID=UPI004033A185
MKNLNEFDVQEMDAKEMNLVDGGMMLFKINWNLVGKWGLAGAGVGGAAGAAAYVAYA